MTNNKNTLYYKYKLKKYIKMNNKLWLPRPTTLVLEPFWKWVVERRVGFLLALGGIVLISIFWINASRIGHTAHYSASVEIVDLDAVEADPLVEPENTSSFPWMNWGLGLHYFFVIIASGFMLLMHFVETEKNAKRLLGYSTTFFILAILICLIDGLFNITGETESRFIWSGILFSLTMINYFFTKKYIIN